MNICFQDIGFPRKEELFSNPFEQKEIIYPHRKTKIKLSTSSNNLCFLEIFVEQNYLLSEHHRFFVWNQTCQVFEIPIGYRYILFKEYTYEIYDQMNKILDWNGSFLSIYE
jgi:hypothetical protein